MKTKKYTPIGVVSSDTLRNEDLIESFADCLEYCMDQYQWQGMTNQEKAFEGYKTLIREARRTR